MRNSRGWAQDTNFFHDLEANYGKRTFPTFGRGDETTNHGDETTNCFNCLGLTNLHERKNSVGRGAAHSGEPSGAEELARTKKSKISRTSREKVIKRNVISSRKYQKKHLKPTTSSFH